jgi:hypothetical protein
VKLLSNLTFLVSSLLLVGGCAVESTQADMVRSALPGGEQVDPGDFAWKMRFNDTEVLVYAVSVGDGTVFTNRDGLQISFDGWDVALVQNLRGALGDVGVIKPGPEPESPGVREHRIQGVGVFEVECPAPERTTSGWVTRCRNVQDDVVYRMPQRIELDPQGRIVRIEAHLLPGAGPMVLTPVSAEG